MRPARIKPFVRELGDAFVRNETLDLAARVAYFGILALFPFAMFVLTLMGFIPLHGLDREIMDGLDRVLLPDVAKLVETTLHEILHNQHGWLLVSTLLFGLWTASGATSELTSALNRAYEVAETRPWWRVKLRALVVTLAGVVGAIVATTAMLVGPELVRAVWSFFGFSGAFDRLWAALRWPVAVIAMTSMVAFTYYFLPNVQQKRRFITPGAIVAVLGWIAASLGLRLYLSHFPSYTRIYGALGTVVLLLVWLYLWGATMIVGGEINAILDRQRRGIAHTEKGPRPRSKRFVLIRLKPDTSTDAS